MKLHEAQAINAKLNKLSSEGHSAFTVEELYSLRNALSAYFQAGFCTVGAFAALGKEIKDAIYNKLKATV